MKLRNGWLMCGAIGLIVSFVAASRGRGTPAASATVAAPAPQVSPASRVEIDGDRFDFGVMGVGETGHHAFSIHNAGPGELRLEEGPATCSCTVGTLSRARVPPGESATLHLGWTPPRAADFFSQGVVVKTNDPARRQLQFMARGQVRAYLAADPETLVFSDVHKGEATSSRVLLRSQVWDDFEVAQIECSHAKIHAEVQPVDETAQPRGAAASVKQLSVTLDRDMPLGLFAASLSIVVRPYGCDDADGTATTNASAARTLTVAIEGEVIGNVSIQGAGLERAERLSLGALPERQGGRRSLSILVRGDRQELTVGDVVTSPSWLQASVGPRQTVSPKLSRYRLDIEIPKTAPPGDFIGPRAARVTIPTDHPEAAELKLRVEFVVPEST